MSGPDMTYLADFPKLKAWAEKNTEFWNASDRDSVDKLRTSILTLAEVMIGFEERLAALERAR